MVDRSPGSVLSAYIPRMTAEWELDAPGALWRELDATCCFVDISGFTALSERLARRGRIGAEELTEVLNHVFSRMLEVAYGKGGALLKFGGDALLLAFTGDDHPRLAAEAAVAMRTALREAKTLPTSVGRVNLKMSVGLHTGIFHLFRVGSAHRELLVTGPAASATTRMEGAADAGEIVLSPATAARLAAGAVGAAKEDGWLLRWRQAPEGGPGPIPARPVPAAAVEESVPLALRARLAQRAGESEHRVACVGFVKFSGVDDLLAAEGPDRTAEALDAVVRTVQEAAALESVTFLATDIDANGGKIILTTGVPAALEDDEGRLLRAARAVMEAPSALPIRIGVNRGHVFAGDVGTAYRRTFTVMGDTVNLAARLMAQANPGEIYATATVLDQARTQFAVEGLEPFMVKGKSEPVKAFDVGRAVGSRTESFGTFPFRGRDKEMAVLAEAFESAAGGRGGAVVIEAERGAGKTRLVSEFAKSAGSDHVLWLYGEPHMVGVPYQPLRAAVRSVLGIDAEAREEAGRQLRASLTRLDASLLPFAPLLSGVVDADVPPTPESDAVAAEYIRARIADLVVGVLDAACPTPLLLVAEDAHWFDETTSDICRRVSAAAMARPWLVCATRRPDAGAGYTPADPAVLLALPGLPDDVAQALIESATDSAPLRPHERDVVVGRAGGNPLFLEELLRIVRATDVESLPDSLDAVAMREIDALATTPRRVLRLASVLGRTFEGRLLEHLLHALEVETGADPLAELQVQLVTDEDGELVRFRHALLQEAAYQSLPYRQRLELHRLAGEAIERDAAEGEAVAPMLSFHFLEAQDWERTWRYARRAALVARAAHATSEEAVHLERALTAARKLRAVDHGKVAAMFHDLGRAQEMLGEYERADDAYRRASLASRSEPLLRGRMAYRRAHLRNEYLGRPAAAIRQLRAGRDALAEVGRDGAGLRALLLAEEANVRERQGNFSVGIARAQEAIAEAEEAGERRALALSLEVLNNCLFKSGHAQEATYMDRVLALYEELGDEIQIAIALNNMAAVRFFASDWHGSAEYLARSADASTKAGDVAGAAIAHMNLGEIRTSQGRLDEAIGLLEPARRTLDSFGYRVMTAQAEMQLGRARVFSGDLDGGLALVHSAVATLDEIGSRMELLDAEARLAEALVFSGRLAEAESELAEARHLARQVGETPLSATLERVELTLALVAGDRGAFEARLNGSLAHAEELEATYDALVLIALAERHGVRESRAQVARLSRELGVLELPMLRHTGDEAAS